MTDQNTSLNININKNYAYYNNLLKKYPDWKKQQTINYEKKLEYLKNNPLSYEEEKENLQRIDNVLDVFDVLDDYGAKKSDGNEKRSFFLSAFVDHVTSLLGAFIGLMVAKIPKVSLFINKMSDKLDKSLGDNRKIKGMTSAKDFINSTLPTLIGATLGYLVSDPISNWISQKNENQRNRQTLNLLKTHLSDPKYFAILTDEQSQKVTYLARKKIEPEMLKEEFESLSYNDYTNLFKKRNNEDDVNLADSNLQQDDLETQKDKQLVCEILEKLEEDTSAYVEKVSYITNSLDLIADIITMFDSAVGAFLFGKIASKSKTKLSSTVLLSIFMVLGHLVAVGISYFAKIISSEGQKVAKFKAKQNLKENPEVLYYVDKEKYKDIDLKDKQLKSQKKQGLIASSIQMYKDLKEYQKFHVKYRVDTRKRQKAMQQIELDPKQYQRAEKFKHNTLFIINESEKNRQHLEDNVDSNKNAVYYIQSIGLNAIAAIIAPSLIYLNKNIIKDFMTELKKKGKNNIFDIKNFNLKNVWSLTKAFGPSAITVALPCLILYWLKNRETAKSQQIQAVSNMQIITSLIK